MSDNIKWECPDCAAPFDDHGKGECKDSSGSSKCGGFICDCDEDSDDNHGTDEQPCPNARCYHCGWMGEFPTGMVKCPTCKGCGKVKRKKKAKS